MRDFTLRFDCNHAAFADEPSTEAAYILEQVADRLKQGQKHGIIHDRNGNTIGRFCLDVGD